MTMSKKTSNCAICDNSNHASICVICVNYRLNEYNSLLKSLKSRRDFLYPKLTEVLAAKGKTDDQLNWKICQNEKLTYLKEKLRRSKNQLAQGKTKIERMSHELKVNYGVLDSARAMLEKNRVEQIEKFYPNLICTQSLGHMAITSECLHKQSVVIKQISKLFPQRRVLRGLAREYWDARPSSRSNEYPLFIPRQNYCSAGEDISWTDRSFSNFGVASMDSEKRFHLDSCGSSSFNHSSASPHSAETHKDLQKGISLLKKSVACITAYCYNSLCLDVPAEASTFEAFSKLLATLSSTKEVRSVFSLKMTCMRSGRQVQQLNKSVWSVNSAMSSSALLESTHMLPLTKNFSDNNLGSSAPSFLFATEMSDTRKNENPIDEWDLVERPSFPPPPSETEDVEHWTRAMFIDATKR